MSDLDNTLKQFKLHQVENSGYPTGIELNCNTPVTSTNKCIKPSGSNTLGAYNVDNTVTPQTFCLTIKNGSNIKKNITHDGIMSDGGCTYASPSAIAANNPVPTTDTIYLSWPQVANAQSFVLERATSADFTANKTTLTPPPINTATTYSSTGLSQGTTYYYRMNVTIDGDISNWGTVSATTRAVYTLTVNVNNGAYGSATGGGTFDGGTVHAITATATGLYAFSSWSGTSSCNGLTTNPLNITMNSIESCTANFILDSNWLAVGTQIWGKYNLNVGAKIDSSSYICGWDDYGEQDIYCASGDQTNNSVLEKHCYNNTESNCTTYGGLYQWDEAMQYVTTEGAQGICPTGSHIPSGGDWQTLVNYLGTNPGTKLKSGGSSGLNMPFAGGRFAGGSFGGLSGRAILWSSSVSGVGTVYRELDSSPYVWQDAADEGDGFSVRCIGN